jgi:hypothetical protein
MESLVRELYGPQIHTVFLLRIGFCADICNVWIALNVKPRHEEVEKIGGIAPVVPRSSILI